MIVAQMFGQTVLVWDGERMLPATLANRLKSGADRGSVGITVGDDVEVEQDGSGALAVVSVGVRRTQLARMSGNGRDVQVVAANAEQAVIVSSAAEPPFRHGLVDRWALLARRGGIDPLLCLNKIDLVTTGEAECMIAEAAIPLRQVLVSVKSGAGMDQLREHLRDRISVMVGHSGVGKSSLLHHLVPKEQIITGALSVKSGKGRHTTSSARLYSLPEGGLVIDTPGVRSVSLGETSASEVANVFPEIEGAPPCRFATCTHRVEPGCSVLAGVERGTIPEHVYARYRKLLLEAEVR
jgi:ribosome biogenesis GTPase